MKNIRITLLCSAVLLAAGSAAAKDTADLNITATVSPGSCTISADKTQLNLGTIPFSDLSADEVTRVVFSESPRVSVSCTALNKGVYFSVEPTDKQDDLIAKDVFSLGKLGATSVDAGTYSLEVVAPQDQAVALAQAAVRCRETSTSLATACDAKLRDDRQYTFEQVLVDGVIALSFELKGTAEIASLNAIKAADADIVTSAQTFATSYTVTAVF